MTLQVLIDQLQILAHEGHAQDEVCIDNCENGTLINGFDIHAHSVIDCGKSRVWLSFGNKFTHWGQVEASDEHNRL